MQLNRFVAHGGRGSFPVGQNVLGAPSPSPLTAFDRIDEKRPDFQPDHRVLPSGRYGGDGRLGRRAVNDGKLVHRLREGKRITIDTLDRIQAYIAASTPGGATPPGVDAAI